MQTFIEKDRERFEKYCMPEPNTGCWLWAGYADAKGYGYMRAGNTAVGRRTVSAHRFSYIVHKGQIPDGLVIDHLCKVTSCCNPDHLEAVTTIENVLRSDSPSAKKARQKACKRGHLFTQENTYIPPEGGRACRTCQRAWDRARRGKLLRHTKAEPTHCTKGHEFTSESSWVDPKGRRKCRICNRQKARNLRLKHASNPPALAINP